MKARRCAILLALLASGAAARDAIATQILISPGQKWDDQLRLANPGDEIILMPGEHRVGLLQDIAGTADKPIVIRGLDPEHPAVIVGDRYGLRLIRPQHLRFRNIVIEEAEVNGINIDGTGEPTSPRRVANPGDTANDVQFINVVVRRTGEKKRKRHAIEMLQVTGIAFKGCRLEGWGASGIEIVGCDDITIDKCVFRGTSAYHPAAGIRARAGSGNLTITNCRFEDTGLTGICAGGVSALKDFPVSVLENAVKASIFEVRHVRIEMNIFIGGSTAVTMTHCDRVQFTRNTIVNPAYYVFCLLQTNDNEQIGPTRRCTIGRNLITWEAGTMQKFFLIDEGVDLMTLKMDQNLWWSTESGDARVRLGNIPQSDRIRQHFDVNPKLDADFAPTAMGANGFGALPISIAQTPTSQTP